MDLRFSEKGNAFREQVRAFLRDEMPADIKQKADIDAHFDFDDIMRWHRLLYRKGWVAPHWPVEFGGPGLSPEERFILLEEFALAGTPHLSPFGLNMVGPLLMQFGTPEQQKRFLPRILSGDDIWCQGYSEPNAGSDLASLRTRAEDDGAGCFIVNGQKTWTTYGQYANWIFCLVRTDSSGKIQHGISFLLIDMKTPGVSVKPMLTIGGTPAFSETFFENVRVPKENLVGPLHGGWTVAKALLAHERTMIGGIGPTLRALAKIKRIARERNLDAHPVYRHKIGLLDVRLRSLEVTNWRTLASASLGQAPGPESSILKIRGSQLQQEAYELMMELMGHESTYWHGPWDPLGLVRPHEVWVPSTFCYNRATTIYGGSNEIQKNIIAKLILGLPS